MYSFRTEIENPLVENDIVELAKKIELFKAGKVDEERFRSLRLARGVYGQRQPGVQMIRIKLPYGKVTSEQLNRIAQVSDKYSTGKLHITTRQDIQIHYVSLDETPQLWEELEQDDITLREACGNAVRNITASETAGIDKNEPFDVTPYAHDVFQFFLRNPICQDMGRKFKIAFSSSEKDTGLTFMHDLGFIPKTKQVNGATKRGFKVMLAGGLGSQPRQADTFYEFLDEDKLIPTIEGVLRVFDRYGERSKRAKARLKFLVKDLGLDEFIKLVEEEQLALAYQNYNIDVSNYNDEIIFKTNKTPKVKVNKNEYQLWKHSNVIKQKQDGLFAVGIKVKLGDFDTNKARRLAELIREYGANELRFTLRQNILIRHVREAWLPFFYQELKKLGFTELGYNKVFDITACPGTDTCNLGIASSTGITLELENVLKEEYPHYVSNQDLTIKISGCMNACGQHNMAQIGFQGMSVRTKDKLVAPALQVLLGGGVLGDGQGRFADKVVKIPSKRGPESLRLILNDFEANANNKEPFLEYYDRQGKTYFYDLLKHLSDVTNLNESDFIDWGHDKNYVKAIGVGECAGVVIDLISTLLFESEEKLTQARVAFNSELWSDSIYHSYTALVNTAKAMLTAENVKTNTQSGIIKSFDAVFIKTNLITLKTSFSELVYQINKNEPSEKFANAYLSQAIIFYNTVDAYRKAQIEV